MDALRRVPAAGLLLQDLFLAEVGRLRAAICARWPGSAARSRLEAPARRRAKTSALRRAGRRRRAGGARGGARRGGSGVATLIVDDRPAPGGSLHYRGGEIEGVFAAEWILKTFAAIEAAGGAFLANTTAYGVYDHNLVSAATRPPRAT